jgi:NADH-quinone oxidoreductase subunit H
VVRQVDGRQVASFVYQYPFQIARLNIGVLFLVAMLSLSVYGIVLGGWASNNKYSFLGALRATAQMISYEIPLALSLLTVVVMFGTLELGEIVEKQSRTWAGFIPAWNIFAQPLAFLMFLICIHAEANRAPFDLAEAEQELVGGYHTEYSSMRFALFFLAEYAGMIVTSAVCVALFFGGWHLPYITDGNVAGASTAVTTSLGMVLLRSAVFFAKTLVIMFVFMWVRWSLPRFRFDQLMILAWRAMIPIALAMVLLTAIVIWWLGPRSEMYLEHRVISGWMALALLGSNVALLVLTIIGSYLIPAPPATNRRLVLADSRFASTLE